MAGESILHTTSSALPTYNPSVAAVDSHGRVSGVSLGEAVITVRSEDPDAEINIASCHVTVRDGKKFIGYIDVTANTGLNSWMYSLKGWGLYTPDYITDGIKDIKVYMDGTELGTAERTGRLDVQSSHPGYINYGNCGWIMISIQQNFRMGYII